LNVRHVGPGVNADRNGTPRSNGDGYTVVNIAGSYHLGHGVTGFGQVDNLLDRHYQNSVGFKRPGLGIFGGSRLRSRDELFLGARDAGGEVDLAAGLPVNGADAAKPSSKDNFPMITSKRAGN
jgi:hypothetical protein